MPKLNELGSLINVQKKQLDSYETKLKDLEDSINEKIEKKVEKSFDMYREREERKYNLIIHNVPEPTTENKKQEDEVKIREIFAMLKCDEIIPMSIVRLGRPMTGRIRLVKITVDSVAFKHKLLGNTKSLREKDGDGNPLHGWSNVYITPDLTKEEREKIKSCGMSSGKERKMRRILILSYREQSLIRRI